VSIGRPVNQGFATIAGTAIAVPDHAQVETRHAIFPVDCLTTMRAGEYGLAAAFGPGFSAELVLMKWH
jgi:hypothetical protein